MQSDCVWKQICRRYNAKKRGNLICQIRFVWALFLVWGVWQRVWIKLTSWKLRMLLSLHSTHCTVTSPSWSPPKRCYAQAQKKTMIEAVEAPATTLADTVALFTSECDVLAKLIYRNFNQHRSTKLFRCLYKVSTHSNRHLVQRLSIILSDSSPTLRVTPFRPANLSRQSHREMPWYWIPWLELIFG